MLLDEILPKDILDDCISLLPLGISNYAYNKTTALIIVEILRENRSLIVGGDVLERLRNAHITHTYDNWSVEEGENDVDSSCDLAIEKIRFYASACCGSGRDILFSLIVRPGNKS